MVKNRESIISSFTDWNTWWLNDEVPDELLGKKRFLKIPLKEIADRKEIKTVSGIRRCGKSTMMYQMIADEIGKGIPPQDIFLVNFDDESLKGMELSSLIEIYKEEIRPKGNIYLYLDEVHNCPEWVGTLRKLYDLRKIGQVFVTDSSSKYISGEYTTLISGRTIDIRLHPLSFREYIQWMNEVDPDGPFGENERISIKSDLDRYLKWGGYPEVVLAGSDIQRKILLREYLDTIIYKDIVERYNASQERLKILVGYLLSNPGSLFSPRRFSRRHEFSLETISKYIEYMKEVNFIHTVPRFHYSYDQVLRSQKKIYIEDTGLSGSFGFNFAEGKGKLMENAVFNEINRCGYEIYYWSDGKSECDLILKNGTTIECAIQVCYDLNEDNLDREMEGLGKCMDDLHPEKGLIITGHRSDLDIDVRKVELWRFMLDPEKYL